MPNWCQKLFTNPTFLMNPMAITCHAFSDPLIQKLSWPYSSICMSTPFYHGPCTCKYQPLYNIWKLWQNFGRSERNMSHELPFIVLVMWTALHNSLLPDMFKSNTSQGYAGIMIWHPRPVGRSSHPARFFFLTSENLPRIWPQRAPKVDSQVLQGANKADSCRNTIITMFDWQYLAEAFKFSASKIFTIRVMASQVNIYPNSSSILKLRFFYVVYHYRNSSWY